MSAEKVGERTKRSSFNIILGLLNNFISLVLAFISRKLFIQYIGVEVLGLNGLFTNILSLLSLADLGFGTAMNYSFYKPLAENDREKLAALIWFYKRVYYIIAVAVAVVGVLLVPFLNQITNADGNIQYLELYYLFFLTNTVVSYLFVYKSSIISADQKNYVVNICQIIINIVKIALQIVVILLLKSYIAYLAVMIIATLLNNILISIVANKKYPYIKEKAILSKEERRGIFDNLKSVFLYKISGTLLNSIDSILIANLISLGMVGYYSNYQTIILNLTSVITIIFTSLTASVANMIIKESSEVRYKIFKVMQLMSFFLSAFVAIGVYSLSTDFVSMWLGTEYVLGEDVVIALSFNIFFSTSMQPLWVFREATGLYRRTKYIMLIAAGVNLILSIGFGLLWGLAGIIWATVLAKMSTYFWYEPHLLFKEYFNQNERNYYFSYIKNIAVMIVCAILLKIIFYFMPYIGILWWILKAIICAVIVEGCYVLLYYRTNEFKYIKEKLRGFFLKRKCVQHRNIDIKSEKDD